MCKYCGKDKDTKKICSSCREKSELIRQLLGMVNAKKDKQKRGAYELLNKHKKQIELQLYKTIKGQIKAGNVRGAMKGLGKKILP